ncbi:alpha/beta-hydrolase [Xylaria bambusicola]|uniref:alpha/beta-hydrolase n=1 Tax=Xylaria bambusicola TaxID=326684 RepID=UPI002008EA42|nr:alpha/beta-hydrolase [Xylaria bambusicola]KAI0512562.1 alpha/beta-hydrolase [Xylaria bambusicola]
MITLNPTPLKPQSLPSKLILITAAALCITISAELLIRPVFKSRHNSRSSPPPYIPSPVKTLSKAALKKAPYPPEDALPGARDVSTPYGSIRVYEWGPEDGECVLFVHGISTPVVALGELGHELVKRGYRVMLFDLFGRGYSDAPSDLTYDARLYTTQILLVLASSKLPWSNFHLVGYSLGGGLSVAFTRYFPRLLRSLILIAPCGFIRDKHVGWRSWLYYNSGILPEFLVKYLVRRRIRPVVAKKPTAAGAEDILAAEGGEKQGHKRNVRGDGDSTGGAGWDSAPISKARPDVTVSDVVAWQVDSHEGFVMAFLSTIRNAPIYAPQEDWQALARILQIRRCTRSTGIRADDDETEFEAGLKGGKICLVLGKDDGVIVPDEMIEDTTSVLGRDAFEFVALEGGHELPFTSSGRVAESIEGFWKII